MTDTDTAIDLLPTDDGGRLVYAASPGLSVEARAFWVGALIFLALVAALAVGDRR
jgi:hypothetical protein